MQAKRASVRDVSNAVVALLAGALLGANVHAQQADPAPVPAAAESAAGERHAGLQALRRARDAQIAGREFQTALKPAQDLVAAQQQSPHDVTYASDLAALGRIYAELRDVDAAESRYLEAITLIAKAEGEFTPTLIDVYRGLGRSYIRGGRYPEAITTLETAQNISQRNLGLFNVEQSPLLDDITTAYLGLGDTTEAQRRQLDRLDNAVRRFGARRPARDPVPLRAGELLRALAAARERVQAVRRGVEVAGDDSRRHRRGLARAAAPDREDRSLDHAGRQAQRTATSWRRCSSTSPTPMRSSAACRWPCSATGPPWPTIRPARVATTAKPGPRSRRSRSSMWRATSAPRA